MTIIGASALVFGAGGCGDAEGTASGNGAHSGQGAGGSTTAPVAPVEVTVAAVRRESLDRTVDVVGTLYGDEEATISAKVSGRIRQILKDIGDRAAPGEELAQVDPTDYELVVAQQEMAVGEALARLGLSELPPADFDVTKVATVQRASLQADNAKARRDRGERLFRQQPPLISEQEFADLQTAYEVAVRDYDVAQLEARSQLAMARARQSELAAARQRLADTHVRAPAGGSDAISAATRPASGDRFAVAQRNVSVGEYVSEGAAMFRLVADDPLKLRAAVPERYLGVVQVGQAVTLRVEGLSEPIEGEVSRISPSVDIASRTFQIEAVVPNAQRTLRPGSFARASVRVGVDPNVPFVPQESVLSFAGLDKVYSVKGGKAVEHAVTLGPKRDGYIAILEGLDDAKEVATTGLTKLSNGVPVEIGAPNSPSSGTPGEGGGEGFY
jgi:RND family efflux transporter MFP subunit